MSEAASPAGAGNEWVLQKAKLVASLIDNDVAEAAP